MFFDGVTTSIFIDQSLLQPSDSPDGELQMVLRTFLEFARWAGSLLDFPALITWRFYRKRSLQNVHLDLACGEYLPIAAHC
jgi:hypothetical protein